MATAKKATKKTAVKKTSSTISKQHAQEQKAAAIAGASEINKTTNPEGSWPFPTGERP